MSFTVIPLILIVVMETVFAFFAVRGIRKRKVLTAILFSLLFIAAPLLLFYLFSIGITWM